MIALHSFRDQWSFAFIFFGIYLIVLGYLIIISGYVPKLVGICLLITGAGWLADSMQPLLVPKHRLQHRYDYRCRRTGICVLAVYKRDQVKGIG